MQSSDMSSRRAATWLAGFFVAAFTLTLGGILYAGNQWWCWHWGDKSVTSTVGSVGGGTRSSRTTGRLSFRVRLMTGEEPV